MQLSASCPSSNPLAALLGAPVQTPTAPAGGAGEFSQLVAELSALPPGTASDVAVVVPQVAPLPAGAMWQSLYSTPASGGDGDGNGSAGPAVAGQQASANASFPQTDSGPSAPVTPGSNRRKILGSGRGSRVDARPVAPVERVRKGLSDQPVAGCIVNSDSAGGIVVPLVGPRRAQELTGLGQDSPARGLDLLPAPEVVAASTPMPVQVPDIISLAAGVSGSVEGGKQGVDGELVQLGEPAQPDTPQGRPASRIVSARPIAARGMSDGELALPFPLRMAESHPASPDNIIGGSDGGVSASSRGLGRGSENVSPQTKSLPFTNRAGVGNVRAEFGELQLNDLGGSAVQSQSPALPSADSGPSKGEPGWRSVPASTVSLEIPMAESGAVNQPPTVRALPLYSRQASPVAGDAMSGTPRQVELSVSPVDRLGSGTEGQFAWADLPPPSEVGAPAEKISPETLGTAPAAVGKTQAQTVVAALSRPGENVREEEAVTGEDENAHDDRASNSRRVTRDPKGEKSAARGEEENMRRGVLLSSHRKYFQKTTEEQHAAGTNDVGIGTANSPATMTSSAFAPRSEAATTAALAATLPTGQRVEFGTSEWKETAEPAEVTGTAQKAVDAVLESVERAAGREQHTVSLKFDMGETPLRVRVEMRAEEVRATFHTDSAELRAALTQEWQAAVAQAPERFTRFDTPVFTSANPGSSSPGSSASDGFARQSHSHSQQAGQEPAGYRSARGERFTTTDGAGTAVSVDPESAPLTSRHLHTRA